MRHWLFGKQPKRQISENAKVQPLMQRKSAFSIRWNPLESRCSRIEQDKIGQWKRRSGPKGRGFESRHFDHKKSGHVNSCPAFLCLKDWQNRIKPDYPIQRYFRIHPDSSGFLRIIVWRWPGLWQNRSKADGRGNGQYFTFLPFFAAGTGWVSYLPRS